MMYNQLIAENVVRLIPLWQIPNVVSFLTALYIP